MSHESKIGLGVVALVVLCCAGPLVLSFLATAAVLVVLSAIWAQGRPLLLGSAALAVGAWLVARRYAMKLVPNLPVAHSEMAAVRLSHRASAIASTKVAKEIAPYHVPGCKAQRTTTVRHSRLLGGNVPKCGELDAGEAARSCRRFASPASIRLTYAIWKGY